MTGIQISLKSAFVGPRVNMNHPFIAMIVDPTAVLFLTTYTNPSDSAKKTEVKMSGAWVQNNGGSGLVNGGFMIIPTIFIVQLFSYVISNVF